MMKKMFFYYVNGTEYATYEAFGTEYRKAKEQARKEHKEIRRLVVNQYGVQKEEYYTKAGCFLDIKYYDANMVELFF